MFERVEEPESIYAGAGTAFGGLPTFLGLPGRRPRLPGGRPRLPRGRPRLPGGRPRLFPVRVTMARAKSLVPSLISAGRAVILFLKPSANESTLAIESEAFLLGMLPHHILIMLA